jgi:hypothetical protein
MAEPDNLLDPKVVDDFRRTLTELEKSIGAPEGTWRDLAQENDWALIIKCHALVEAALTHSITSSTDSRFRDIFVKLALGREDRAFSKGAKAGINTRHHLA